MLAGLSPADSEQAISKTEWLPDYTAATPEQKAGSLSESNGVAEGTPFHPVVPVPLSTAFHRHSS